jgi:hypothetical protein
MAQVDDGERRALGDGARALVNRSSSALLHLSFPTTRTAENSATSAIAGIHAWQARYWRGPARLLDLERHTLTDAAQQFIGNRIGVSSDFLDW